MFGVVTTGPFLTIFITPGTGVELGCGHIGDKVKILNFYKICYSFPWHRANYADYDKGRIKFVI